MELYCRSVNIFDEKIMNDFLQDYIDNDTYIKAGDCSLFLNKNYHEFDSFYDWYKLVSKLDNDEVKKNQVGCTTYLVFRKKDDELVAIFDLRHSLDFPDGDIYGHIGVDIKPSLRGKDYYDDILKLGIEVAKTYDIKTFVISCMYDNIASKRGIEHIFSEPETIPFNGNYVYVYKKEI